MHIVHLEDESPLREILRVALVAAVPDANLQQFINSDKAMAYVDEHMDEIDLYILDIRVPGSMDGMEFARKLRERQAKGIVAVTSAYRAPDRTELDTLKLEWFAKPWHIMEVLDKLLPMIRPQS
jgi:DNA-binding response OmpR family regulator